ncbi:MAG: hypothetical protein WCT32_04590 [Patescibacteria group bacterium]|jgi:hypothetical protein
MYASATKHFVLGLILGLLSIILLFAMYNSVVATSPSDIRSGNVYIIILAYGFVTMLLGVALDSYQAKRKKKRK